MPEVGLDMESIKNRVMSGVLFYIGARGHRFIVEKFARKQLKKYGDLVGPGLALGIEMVGVKEMFGGMEEYADHLIDAISDFGIYKTVEVMVEKKPVCFFSDANTIVVYNLGQTNIDVASLTVKIDGTTVAATDISNVSGTSDELTISLANPVASGKHELVIVGDGTKACYNPEAYV